MSKERETLLTPAEISKYYKWSIWARPVTMYSLTAVMSSVCFTTCYLLLTEKASLADASAVLMAIVGAAFPIIGAQVLGKSWERVRGAAEENTVVPAAGQSTSPTTPANGTLVGVTQSAVILDNLTTVNDPLAMISGNPLELLNSMDLDEYMPKIADDKPVIP